MPNHITNILSIDADNKKEIVSAISGRYDDGSPIHIDFNSIKPMPERLSIEPHSGIISAAESVMDVRLNDFPLTAALEKSNRSRALQQVKGFNEDEFELFLSCLKNIRDYGHATWYSWSVDNWGTKWNAYSQEINNDAIKFETAWSGVTEMIQALSLKFPKATFNYKYADEDTGSNVGKFTIKDGSIAESYTPESQTKEAYELAFDVYGQPDYYKLVDGEYVYIDEDDEVENG